MTNTLFTAARNLAKIFSWILLCAASESSAAPVTQAQADSAVRALNTVYWNATGKHFHKLDNKTGRLDFWMSAHAWETILEAYVRTGNAAYKQQVTDLYDGFVAFFGANWRTNRYNDDIAWWVLACTHVYDVTREQRYLDQAKSHFDWLYSTQVDNVLGGGMYWLNSEHTTKNACVNGPAIIAALNLARLLGDTTYRAKAATLYAWQKSHLTETNGKVYDKINLDGSTAKGSTTYNQGTWIGAALGLNHLADAQAAANWTRTNLTDANGVLRNTNQGDFATFNQIFVRYVLQLGRLAGQSTYVAWMETNAQTVWNNRRRSDNIMGYNWAVAAPSSGIESQGAVGGVTLLNLLATPIASGIGDAPRGVPSGRPRAIFISDAGNFPGVFFGGKLRAINGKRLAYEP